MGGHSLGRLAHSVTLCHQAAWRNTRPAPAFAQDGICEVVCVIGDHDPCNRGARRMVTVSAAAAITSAEYG